jgi:Leucine-rich repeat (LRR) protein
LGKLHRLTYLNVSGNTLPDSIARLARLHHLDLRANRFSTLPEVITPPPSLEKLDFALEQDLGRAAVAG